MLFVGAAGAVCTALGLLGATMSQQRSPQEEDSGEPLTVEETMGLVFSLFRHGSPAHLFARANPDAKPVIYRVLDNKRAERLELDTWHYYYNAWVLLGRIGDEGDVERFERAIERFKQIPRALTAPERKTLKGILNGLGLLCRREEGARRLMYKLMDPAHWQDAKFTFYPEEVRSRAQSEGLLLYYVVDAYSASLRPDVAQRAQAVLDRIKDPEGRKIAAYYLSADLLAAQANMKAREAKPVTAAERRALRASFNGDLENPGPPTEQLAAAEEYRQQFEQWTERRRRVQEQARAAITDPRAQRLFALAWSVFFPMDDALRPRGEIHLILREEKITDEVLALLDAVPQVTHLQIEQTAATDQGLRHVGRLEKLEMLYIADTPGVTDKGLAHLAGLSSLRSLALKGLPKVSDQGLRHLSALKGLEHLSLAELGISFEGLKSLSALGSLREFYVSFAQPAAAEQPAEELSWPGQPAGNAAGGQGTVAEDARARRLRELAHDFWLDARGQVVSLSLFGPQITDQTLALLSGVPELTDLSLVNTAVSDKGLKHVGALPKLERLSISRDRLSISRSPQVTDAGLRWLEGLTSLKAVNLDYLPKVTDKGLRHLGTLEGLETVHLTELGITFGGLQNLAGLKKIRIIEVEFPTPRTRPRR